MFFFSLIVVVFRSIAISGVSCIELPLPNAPTSNNRLERLQWVIKYDTLNVSAIETVSFWGLIKIQFWKPINYWPFYWCKIVSEGQRREKRNAQKEWENQRLMTTSTRKRNFFVFLFFFFSSLIRWLIRSFVCTTILDRQMHFRFHLHYIAPVNWSSFWVITKTDNKLYCVLVFRLCLAHITNV